LTASKGRGFTRHPIKLALQQDTDYADAHTWLARTKVFEWIMGWKKGEGILNRTYEQARKPCNLTNIFPMQFLF
jgi:hypothetical protein